MPVYVLEQDDGAAALLIEIIREALGHGPEILRLVTAAELRAAIDCGLKIESPNYGQQPQMEYLVAHAAQVNQVAAHLVGQRGAHCILHQISRPPLGHLYSPHSGEAEQVLFEMLWSENVAATPIHSSAESLREALRQTASQVS